ncbi:MAG: alpha/beta fold hydrolase [Deltaproteobacteria bacterium]|nr:alpha/beta fold hydrolase [Deltaproteobacteria bacterium]
MAHAVLIHGLTSTPGQLAPLKESLVESGWHVHAPLLRGHGTTVADLVRCHWEDWYADVLAAVEDARSASSGEPIDVVGLSLGALLGLKLAIDYPTHMRRLVCLATPLYLYQWANVLLAGLRYTPIGWFVSQWPKNFQLAVHDPEGQAVYRAAGYAHFPVPAVTELVKLQQVVQAGLAQVQTPLLVIHSRADMTAPPRSATAIEQTVGGPVDLCWLTHSYHVVTLDYDRELVAERVVKFFRD